jgi:hypothetical protein
MLGPSVAPGTYRQAQSNGVMMNEGRGPPWPSDTQSLADRIAWFTSFAQRPFIEIIRAASGWG